MRYCLCVGDFAVVFLRGFHRSVSAILRRENHGSCWHANGLRSKQETYQKMKLPFAKRLTYFSVHTRLVGGWSPAKACLAVLGLSLACQAFAAAALDQLLRIPISTQHSQLTLMVGPDRHLYQLNFGASNPTAAVPSKPLVRNKEFYPPAGDGFLFEPALQAVHSDGNTSTDLQYVKHETSRIDANVTLTRIELKDAFYPLHVVINLQTYLNEDVIEQWEEIVHDENGTVTLERFASSAPEFSAGDYWLTQLHGDWAKEASLMEEKLTYGIKVLDTKLGIRAHQYRTPAFMLAKGGPAKENTGEVFGGTLGWSGSYQFAFEVDPYGRLRALAGINPFASAYHLARGKMFATPKMYWTWSSAGKGQVSRNFHRWARHYVLRNPDMLRPVLLNNWEATHFDFDEPKLVSLFGCAQELGADVFLLDDGWFGDRFPRDNDKAGLGDWLVNPRKLPHGLSFLTHAANQRAVRFGIWLEPEMVNPASEIYQRHPDWVIGQPHREPQLQRNQLILDLTRPEAHEYVWQVINKTLQPNPDISYVKWDCNRFVTQPGSFYLRPEEQSHLLIDYNWALYEVMARFATNYPNVTAMLCSGGGGRVDYQALRYFHTFWPSDRTDPCDRVFIQWGYSQFFPACAMAAHVTRMGSRPFKFTLDVAMSGALGFDVDFEKLAPDQKAAAIAAVTLYKSDLRPIVQQGDLYRLSSPYDGPRSALNYVSDDRTRAVLFVYQIGAGVADPVKPQGLDPQRQYRVREVNLPAGVKSSLPQSGTLLSGSAWMRDGVTPACTREFDSAVIEFTAE